MKRAIDFTENLVKFHPWKCDASHAVIIIGSSALAGFLGGISIAFYLAQ